MTPEVLKAYYRELLRLVGRFLFLFYAESRKLIPHGGELAWVYEQEYGVSALREKAVRQDPFSEDRRADLWGWFSPPSAWSLKEGAGRTCPEWGAPRPEGLPLLTGASWTPGRGPLPQPL